MEKGAYREKVGVPHSSNILHSPADAQCDIGLAEPAVPEIDAYAGHGRIRDGSRVVAAQPEGSKGSQYAVEPRPDGLGSLGQRPAFPIGS